MIAYQDIITLLVVNGGSKLIKFRCQRFISVVSLMRQRSLSFSHISSFGRRRVPLVNEIGLLDANKIIEW